MASPLLPPPNKAFGTCLDALTARVDQILQYHRIEPARTPPHESIAHFATWGACQAMLKAVKDQRRRRGVVLWAGDANCLNDPLEGRALIKFAEDVFVAPSIGKASHPRLGGWPHWASKPLVSPLPANNLERRNWRRLHRIVRSLYDPPRPSATGWYEPRRVPSSQLYLVSFCRDTDRLDLWRAYGDNGNGVSLIMPLLDAAKRVAKTDWGFYRVVYDPGDMQRAWILLETPLHAAWRQAEGLPPEHKATGRSLILQTISSVLHLYKHSQFATENEIRLVYRGSKATPRTESVKGELRPVLETPPFFLFTPGCRVIIGPTTTDRSRRIASLQVLLSEAFPTQSPQVQVSGVPYQ